MKLILNMVIFLYSLSALCADIRVSYKDFYYLEKQIMEARLAKFLSEDPGLLLNYPHSDDPEEITKESELLIKYGLLATETQIEEDVREAIQEKEYYGLIMIFASIQNDNNGIQKKEKLILSAEVEIGDDKYLNAILGMCVKILITKRLLVDDEGIRNISLIKIKKFTSKLRSFGFDSKEFKYIKSIDFDILNICVEEIVK
jgi:hypothetical protein